MLPSSVPRTWVVGVPLSAIAVSAPASVGPLMSVRKAFGACQAIQGARTNPAGDSVRDFIAPMMRCWRRARVRSFSLALQAFLRVRASASAWSPLRWVFTPERMRTVTPPFA